MVIGLIIILLVTLFLPLLSKKVEHNLEIFLLVVGLAAAIISQVLSVDLVIHILQNKFLYLIGIAVFCGGMLFKALSSKTKNLVDKTLKVVPLEVFIFLAVVLLGIVSSMITAIIAALLLVEIVNMLPLSRKGKINLTIISCFSIGLGATLTPIGEPLSTIVVSKLEADFWYLLDLLGVYVIPSILLLGLLGAWSARFDRNSNKAYENILEVETEISATVESSADAEGDLVIEEETYKDLAIRTVKIFAFIIALELLGAGFKPIIDNYIVNLDSRYLYWINISSAVLDNATLASAEISSIMTDEQIKVILTGLLISGGMMITGNIPNIISANKLKIKSKEWIALGVPLGLVLMVTYYVVLFIA